MSAIPGMSTARRVLVAASAVGFIACGGDTAAPEAPNPLGVADTIVLAISSPEVIIGDTLRLTVVARDAGGAVVPNVVLVWRSLNPTIATVSAEGVVTALDIGEAEIEVEATIPGSSMALVLDSSMVGTTALKPVKSKFKIMSVPKLVITPGSATVVEKDHQLFTARITNVTDQQLANRPVVRWSSTNPAVASIDATGLATALTKGTTTIRASVTVGSSQAFKTATLTVSDALCGGIAGVATLNATLNYDYTAAGALMNTGRVASELHAQATATMTNLGWEPGIPTVVFKGPMTGNATQVETVHNSRNEETRRLEGAGAIVNVFSAGATSEMTVIVELTDCTYRMEAGTSIMLTSFIDGNRGLTLPMPSAQVFVGAGKRMNTTGGNPFPVIVNDDFEGHTLLWPLTHPTADVFVPRGYAASLAQQTPNGPVGNADVSYVITVVR